jgi:membrane protein implicated in regulation of membrane protease activity
MPEIPFLLVFTVGLGLAVFTMLQGVTAGPTARRTTRIGMLTAPSLAAFGVVFGALGYLCTTHTSLSYVAAFAIAVAGGAATIPVSAPLLARVAKARSGSAPQEEELEGQVAKVLRAVTSSALGEVVYSRDGREFRHPALNLAEGTLESGRDVVIDRVENGTAYVEDWETVEKRL